MNPNRRTFIDRYGRLTIDLPDAMVNQVIGRWCQVARYGWSITTTMNTVDGLIDRYVPWEPQTSEVDDA